MQKNPNQLNQNLNIALDKTLPVACESCGNETFVSVIYLRKASKFLTGTPQDAIIPLPTFACAKCNHVNRDMDVTSIEN